MTCTAAGRCSARRWARPPPSSTIRNGHQPPRIRRTRLLPLLHVGDDRVGHPRHLTSGFKSVGATPDEAANAQRQLGVLQWVTRVLTGALAIFGPAIGRAAATG